MLQIMLSSITLGPLKVVHQTVENIFKKTLPLNHERKPHESTEYPRSPTWSIVKWYPYLVFPPPSLREGTYAYIVS